MPAATFTESVQGLTRPIFKLWIFLADNEWGNDLMEHVAREYANGHPERRPLVVSVYEHAGWFLEFYFDEAADGVVIGTANDTARFVESVLAIRRMLGRSEIRALPEIRRRA